MKKIGLLAAALLTTGAWAQDVCQGKAPFVQLDKATVNVARGETISLAYCDRITKTKGYKVTRDGDTVYVDVSADTTRNRRIPISPMNIPVDLKNVNLDKDKVNLVVRADTSYTITGQTPMIFTPIEINIAGRDKVATAVSDPSGSWYDPAYNGAGFVVVQTPVGNLVQFYGYMRRGERLWLLSNIINETWVLGKSKTFTMYYGAPGNAATFDLAPTQPPGVAEWGTVTIQFDSCNGGKATLVGVDGTKTFNLQKITGLANIHCTSAAAN